MPRPLRPERYIQGNPCRYGHSGLRYLSNHACVECNQTSTRDRQRTLKQVREELRASDATRFPAAMLRASKLLRDCARAFIAARACAPRGGWRSALKKQSIPQKLAAAIRRHGELHDGEDWLD